MSGDDRYDDDFLELKDEIDLINSATGEVDFDKIVELGRLVLSQKSKDLRTLGYLSLGLIRARGIEGLAESWAVAEALAAGGWR